MGIDEDDLEIIGEIYIPLALNKKSIESNSNIKDENFPIIAMALISIPILDTLRIIFLRIYWLYSPFKSDKKWHIHDILIESGMSHIRTSLFLTIINFFNAILIFLIESNFNSYYLISIYFSVSIFWLLFFEFIRRRFSKINS